MKKTALETVIVHKIIKCFAAKRKKTDCRCREEKTCFNQFFLFVFFFLNIIFSPSFLSLYGLTHFKGSHFALVKHAFIYFFFLFSFVFLHYKKWNKNNKNQVKYTICKKFFILFFFFVRFSMFCFVFPNESLSNNVFTFLSLKLMMLTHMSSTSAHNSIKNEVMKKKVFCFYIYGKNFSTSNTWYVFGNNNKDTRIMYIVVILLLFIWNVCVYCTYEVSASTYLQSGYV